MAKFKEGDRVKVTKIGDHICGCQDSQGFWDNSKTLIGMIGTIRIVHDYPRCAIMFQTKLDIEPAWSDGTPFFFGDDELEPLFNPGTKPSVKMVGEDGNAFAIMGRCKRAARNCRTAQEWERFQEEAVNGDYNHLLGLVMTHFSVDERNDS